jgi:hypothetical protein
MLPGLSIVTSLSHLVYHRVGMKGVPFVGSSRVCGLKGKEDNIVGKRTRVPKVQSALTIAGWTMRTRGRAAAISRKWE